MKSNDYKYSLQGKRVWVAGHKGMVGSAIVKRLGSEDCEVVTVDRSEVDLRRQAEVENWMNDVKPHAIFMAAATVGGIHVNDTQPARFLYDNLMIESNIIHTAHLVDVEKFLFLGSSCVYPRMAPQPIREDSLLTGALEPTNEWYAIAKITGIKLCQAVRKQYAKDFISAMPTNLYGQGDNFNLESSHVIPALIVKACDAKREALADVEIWGTGAARREFLFVEDLADALVFMMKHYSDSQQLNVGTGEDVSIKELAETVCRQIDFEGDLRFDTSRPDGTPRKLLDVSRMSELGWRAATSLESGLQKTCRWYLANLEGNIRH